MYLDIMENSQNRVMEWHVCFKFVICDLYVVLTVFCTSSWCCVVLLQLCVILEPMQELMSRHKTYSLSPRDCLKTCLFQKWQRMVAPPGRPSSTWTAR